MKEKEKEIEIEKKYEGVRMIVLELVGSMDELVFIFL